MIYYYRNDETGVGITSDSNLTGVTWITEEEFNAQVAENEKREAEEQAAAATEQDYLAALEVLGVSE